MTQVTFSIGDLSRETGCKIPLIRWYEQVGMLSAPARTSGGHRAYGREHLERLDFIRHCREFGFPLDAIRELLALAGQPSCAAAHEIASAQLATVEGKLKRLESLRAELANMVETGCRGAPADCRILATLADHDHGHCLTDEHAHEPVLSLNRKMSPKVLASPVVRGPIEVSMSKRTSPSRSLEALPTRAYLADSRPRTS